MNSNPIEEKKSLIAELRVDLLLALKYSRGENANFIRVEGFIRDGLNTLSKIERNKKEEK